jgi:hypothetical protein
VLLRFADFLLIHRDRSFEKNWKIFCRRGGNFGRRRHMRKRAVNGALKKSDPICLMADSYFRPKISGPDYQI